MIRVEASVEIRRSASDVFIADFENDPRWRSGVFEACWTSDPPVGVGSTYEQRARFLGRDIRTSFRVTGHEPGRRIAIESEDDPFPIRVVRTVAGDADRATAGAVVEGDARGFFRLAGPVLAFLVRWSVRKDYRRLKRVLEAGCGRARETARSSARPETRISQDAAATTEARS